MTRHIDRLPRGLCSLAGLLWAVAFLTAGVWLLAGTGAGLLACGVFGCTALFLVDVMREPPPGRR